MSEKDMFKLPSLQALIHKHIVSKTLNNERKYDIFHPSAWGSCLRCVSYQFYNQKHGFLKKTPSDVDARMERIFDNGHGMHARWQKYLAYSGIIRGYWSCIKCGMVYGKDQRLGILSPNKTEGPDWTCNCGSRKELIYGEVLVRSEPQYNFEGHVDAVVDIRGTDLEQGNEYDVFVLDFKTMRDSYFSDLRQAKHEHVIQVSIYMWLLELQGAVVLYENKDDQNIKEFFIPRDESLITRIKGEALWLVEVLKHGKLPSRPTGFSMSNIPCRFCDFRKLCYA